MKAGSDPVLRRLTSSTPCMGTVCVPFAWWKPEGAIPQGAQGSRRCEAGQGLVDWYAGRLSVRGLAEPWTGGC